MSHAATPEILLLAEQRIALKDLKGISKTASTPQKGVPLSQKYLNDLAFEHLDENLQSTFAKLRSNFSFKRKELTADGPVDGIGVISTPAFIYEVTVIPIEDDNRKVLVRRCIRQISEADAITGAEFAKVFETDFNQLQVASETNLDLEDIIDRVEDAESTEVEIDYDKDVTWCKIGVSGTRTTITIQPNEILVTGPADVSPEELIDSFFELQNTFMDSLNLSEPLLKKEA